MMPGMPLALCGWKGVTLSLSQPGRCSSSLSLSTTSAHTVLARGGAAIRNGPPGLARHGTAVTNGSTVLVRGEWCFPSEWVVLLSVHSTEAGL